MKSWIHIFQFCALILTLPSCSPEPRKVLRRCVSFAPKSERTHIDFDAIISERPTITVWIHGTRLFDMKGLLRNFQFSKPGLHRACEYEEKYHMHTIGKTLVNAAPQRFSYDSVYVFGWSGRLDFGVREQAAITLYKELNILSERYHKEHGVYPAIRLITHSHGGNVALNLARIGSKKEHFCIDELILLACPVQEKTASLIRDPLFKKIFCIYSQLDMCQILDPQGWYKDADKTAPWLSKRYFPEQDNLEQVRIKLNGRAIFHSEFVFERFISFLPEIIDAMETWNKESLKHKPHTSFTKSLHVRTNGKPFKRTRKRRRIT